MADEPVDVFSPLPADEEAGFPPFLPSQALALAALAASGEEGDLGERLTVPPEGPYIPVWEESPVLERLRQWLAGQGIPPNRQLDTDELALVERVRRSLGARVDRLFANMAFRASFRGEQTLALSEDGQFRPWVRERLLSNLLLDPEKAKAVLTQLHHDLCAEARAGRFGGDWGQLAEDQGSLLFKVAPWREGGKE